MMQLPLLLLLAVSTTYGARILGVFTTSSVSHQVVFQPIWKELSLRGHDVVVITPNPLRDPKLTNLTEIDVSFLYTYPNEQNVVTHERTHWDLLRMKSWNMRDLGGIIEHPPVADMLRNKNISFDLMIAEVFSTVVTPFSYRFNCPLVGIASLSVLSPTHEAIGNPAHPLLHPDLTTTFGEDMTFWEKIDAVLFAIVQRIKHYADGLPRFDAELRRYFGPDMPYLGDLERNMSLLLLNTNPVIHGARAYTTAVVELGMMHLKKKKALPRVTNLFSLLLFISLGISIYQILFYIKINYFQNLKKFLDDAKEGVIYFNLGSNIKSNQIDETKRIIIMEVFSQLPYKVLWKFESEELPNKPSNVNISTWLPQQDLLGHPNIKLFITQGGLQSLEEAITNEVPLLAIPFWADQHGNSKRIAKLEIGLHLVFSTLTKETFKSSIVEIIENPKYKQKIREVNKIIHDQPMNSLERAVWWIEYVIRHKGAPYFRNRVVDMPWYEYFLLDVIGFVLLVICIVVMVLYKSAKALARHSLCTKIKSE